MRGIIYDDHKREIDVDTTNDTIVCRRGDEEYYYRKSRKGNKIYYMRNGETLELLDEDKVLAIARTPGKPYHIEEETTAILLHDEEQYRLEPGEYWTHKGIAKEFGVSESNIRSQIHNYNLGIKFGSLRLLRAEEVRFLHTRMH